MAKELEGSYEPGSSEERHYRRSEAAGHYRPEAHPQGLAWCLVIPPPNVTGALHMGHALEQVMMDSVTRVRRMQGRAALYLPGVDHAGIATQNMVEAELRREGSDRHQIGRERFVARAHAWKETYHERIRAQIRTMGASCDWSRERFTLDDELSASVRHVFVELHRRGLIYRAPRIINWCVRCRTALSDLEVEFETQSDLLHQIHYPRPDGSEGVVVATVRPETLFGDVAVAVHANDDRWRSLIGHDVMLPLADRPIPVIADDYVDPEFGTGALKITPGHDPNDYAVGARHQLASRSVIALDGTMKDVPERYLGLSVRDARKAAVAELDERGLLRKSEPYEHKVGRCQRCNTVAEPLISTQWFVAMEPLARKAIAAVASGETRFVPERWTKVYLDWLENIRDWCVSRQLWWGHRIPAWYCACGETIVAESTPAACPACGGAALTQDDDVLDTWFSSGLWPFSTLGWPQATADFAKFYPTQLLITGYDIIFFWVARMMMLGLEMTGRAPFAKVVIHGLVRDEKGQKMSKTRGNVIDPMELGQRHGIDPLRFGLASLTTQGQDFALTEDRFQSARFFLNKLWNAAKFVLKNTPDGFVRRPVSGLALSPADRWILTRLDQVTTETTRLFEEVELAPIAKSLYAFTWNELCDWYLELAKIDLYGDDPERASTVLQVLHAVLADTLKLLHPIVPFATTDIWEALPGTEGELMMAAWPTGHGITTDPGAASAVSDLFEVVRALRALRSDVAMPPSHKAEARLRAPDATRARLVPFEAAVMRLAGLGKLTMTAPGAARARQALYATFGDFELELMVDDPALIAQEKLKLEKTLAKLGLTRAQFEKKLDNPRFVEKAAPEIVAKDRATLSETLESIARLEERLQRLSTED